MGCQNVSKSGGMVKVRHDEEEEVMMVISGKERREISLGERLDEL